MDYKSVSIFKETMMEPELTMSAFPETSRKPDAGNSDPKKKKKHTSKELIVPGNYILDCLEGERKLIFPIQISMRYPKGGVSWQIGSRSELTGICHIKDLAKCNLAYARTIDKTLYLEFTKKGKITVDIKWLPEVSHGTVLSEIEARRLWKKITETRTEQEKQKGPEYGPGFAEGYAA